jgi:hypothetical protein
MRCILNYNKFDGLGSNNSQLIQKNKYIYFNFCLVLHFFNFPVVDFCLTNKKKVDMYSFKWNLIIKKIGVRGEIAIFNKKERSEQQMSTLQFAQLFLH